MPFDSTQQAQLEEAAREVVAEAQQFDAASFQGFDSANGFCQAWPTIRKVLNTAKLLTPGAVDEVIDAIVAAGQRHCGLS